MCVYTVCSHFDFFVCAKRKRFFVCLFLFIKYLLLIVAVAVAVFLFFFTTTKRLNRTIWWQTADEQNNYNLDMISWFSRRLCMNQMKSIRFLSSFCRNLKTKQNKKMLCDIRQMEIKRELNGDSDGNRKNIEILLGKKSVKGISSHKSRHECEHNAFQ